MRVMLVVNPNSRRGAQLGDAVADALRRHGVEIAAQPSQEGTDAIVAAGGDGTLAREIPRALAMNVPVGVVPLGTFNDLARTLGIPPDLDGASAVIASGRTRTIDAARVNAAYYLTEASIGISSRLARRQRPQDKRRFGLLAVAATALEAVRYARPIDAEIEYDGERERLRVVQLTVANSQRFGGFITAAGAAIDDGWLDCYCVTIANPWQLPGVARAILSGRRRSVRGLRVLRSTAFEVWTRHRHHISADGEPAGTTPARFEILHEALRVFAP